MKRILNIETDSMECTKLANPHCMTARNLLTNHQLVYVEAISISLILKIYSLNVSVIKITTINMKDKLTPLIIK